MTYQRIPMHERVLMARNAIENHKVHNKKQLSVVLNWSPCTANRVCEYEPGLIAVLNSNRPPRKARRYKATVKRDKLHPVLLGLYDHIENSTMTWAQITKKSGMSHQFFRDVFISGHLPSMNSLLAVCGAIGLDLKLVRVADNKNIS